MKRRPQLKAVLLALADRADDDGLNAWPSVATIAAEAEFSSRRTVDAYLGQLREHGLISEQAPPRQHHPRVWRLNLGTIVALIPQPEPDAQTVAPLDTSDTQQAAPLTHVDTQTVAPLRTSDGPDTQKAPARRAESKPDTQILHPDTQLFASEQSVLNCPLEQREQERALSFSEIQKDREERRRGYDAIKRVASELLSAGSSFENFDVFIEATRQQCLRVGIDPFDELGAACCTARAAYALTHRPVVVPRRQRAAR